MHITTLMGTGLESLITAFTALSHRSQQSDDLPFTHFEAAESGEQRGYRAHGEASGKTQVCHEGMHSGTEAALPHRLFREVWFGSVSLLADPTVSLHEEMLKNLYRDFGQLKDLSGGADGSSRESASTVGALLTGMNDLLCGCLSASHKGVFPLLAWVLFGRWFWRLGVCFDPIGGRCFGFASSFEACNLRLEFLYLFEEQGNGLLLLCDKEEKFFFAEGSHICHNRLIRDLLSQRFPQL
jgi:hypothetical protein